MILVNLTVFSQKDTKTTTDSIRLPKIVAKEVVKDILRKDSCEAQIVKFNKNYKLLETNILAKDSIIAIKNEGLLLWEQKGKNYETMLLLKDTQRRNLELSVDILHQDIKRLKRENLKLKIFGGITIAGLTYLLLK